MRTSSSTLLFAVLPPAFLVALTGGAIPVLLPGFVDLFSLGTSEAGLVNGSYGLGRLLGGILLGVLAGRVRLGALLFAALAAVGVGLEVSASAPSYPVLALSRVCTGVGFGGVVGIMLLVLLTRSEGMERVRMLSALEIALVVGLGAGGVLSGALMPALGVRGLLRVLTGLALIAAWLCWRAWSVWVLPPASPRMEPGQAFRSGSLPALARLAPAYLVTMSLTAFWQGLLCTVFPLYATRALGLSNRFVGGAISMVSWGEVAVLLCMPVLLKRFRRMDLFAVSIAGICAGSPLLFTQDDPSLLVILLWMLGMFFSAWIVPVSVLPELHGGRSVPPWALAGQRVAGELGGMLGPIALAAAAQRCGFVCAAIGVTALLGVSGLMLLRVYLRVSRVAREPRDAGATGAADEGGPGD